MQQGIGFPFFGKTTFSYLCGMEMDQVVTIIEETPDATVRALIKDVCICNYVYIHNYIE